MPQSTPTGAYPAPAPTLGLDGPEFTSELLAALDAGYELEEYLSARAAGVTHQELVELDLPQNRTPSEYIAARVAGATPAQIAEVVAVEHPRFDEIGLDEYAAGRTSGATHAALLDAHSHGVTCYPYGRAHAAGATHTEIIAMQNYYGDYALARASGATHQEVLDAQAAKVDVANYDVIRSLGTSHTQALEALQYSPETAGPGVGWYLVARWQGVTHEQAMKELADFYTPH